MKDRVQATKYHDICAGHRVHGHESKCAHLHGHNYRIHFTVEGDVDDLGRVIDFSVIGEKLCAWVEKHYDHRFLIWDKDPIKSHLIDIDPKGVLVVPYNPTAENMGMYLVKVVGPRELADTTAVLVKVQVDETRKCSATYLKGE